MLCTLDISPYEFACDGPLFGIPHGLNVLTNLPFLFVGAWGLWRLARLTRETPVPSQRFFDLRGLWISVALLTIGSGAYHYFLTPSTLALDRLCIAGIIAFVGAEAAVWTLGWRPSRARSLLLLVLSLGTVVFWMLGGTAWVYGAVQAVGGLTVILLYVRALRRGRVTLREARPVFLFLGLYAVSKVFEGADALICDWTGVFGGHPWKHLIAAAGLLALTGLGDAVARRELAQQARVG